MFDRKSSLTTEFGNCLNFTSILIQYYWILVFIILFDRECSVVSDEGSSKQPLLEAH